MSDDDRYPFPGRDPDGNSSRPTFLDGSPIHCFNKVSDLTPKINSIESKGQDGLLWVGRILLPQYLFA
jgi:hypothetical protein